jgi:predicted peptidase
MSRILATIANAFPRGGGCGPEPEAREFHSGGKRLLYRLLRPAEVGGKRPLVVMLHGAGERGCDNRKQLAWFWDARKPRVLGRPEFAAAGAFVAVPQCPDGQQWVDVPWSGGCYASPAASESLGLTLALIDSLPKEFPIDPDRVYAVGMSMGGFGVFDAAQRRPDLFAALVSVCGAGDPARARDIAHVPVWAFHGDQDDVVPVAGSRETVAALRAAGGAPRYTEYRDTGHNSWSPAFAEPGFWAWIFAQTRRRK